MLVALPKTCGNKVRRQWKRLRIEEWNIWKQAKRRQERRYKRLPNLSKRTFCGRLPEPQGCRKRGAFLSAPVHAATTRAVNSPDCTVPLSHAHFATGC